MCRLPRGRQISHGGGGRGFRSVYRDVMLLEELGLIKLTPGPGERGNGLKFVAKYIENTPHALICYSQNNLYSIGKSSKKINFDLFPKDFSTLFCIEWRGHSNADMGNFGVFFDSSPDRWGSCVFNESLEGPHFIS